MCKIMTSRDALFIFFKILIFQVVQGVKVQKMVQKDKTFCLTPYLRYHTSYDCGFWYTLVKRLYPLQFFCFFKILIFLVFRRRQKGKKMTHNYQIQSVTLYISRTVGHIKIFGTQM